MKEWYGAAQKRLDHEVEVIQRPLVIPTPKPVNSVLAPYVAPSPKPTDVSRSATSHSKRLGGGRVGTYTAPFWQSLLDKFRKVLPWMK